MVGLQQQLAIGMQLLRREWRVFVESWHGTAIDAVIIACTFSLSIGYFMPAMGMPAALRLPVFIGTIIVFCVSESYATGLNIALDFDGNRMLEYHASLPIRLWVVGAAYVLGTMMRIILVATPVFLLGLTFLGEWSALAISWPQMVAIVLLTALFWSVLFLTLALWCSTNTMLGDVWARFIAPMFTFGCTFFPWRQVADYAPRIGKLLLINPMTHCVEGFRGALLPSQQYVPFSLVVTVLCLYGIGLFYLFHLGLRRRLQTVTER